VAGKDKLRIDFNKEWLRFTGRTLQEESGEGWMQSMHPADRSAFIHKFDQSFDERQRFAAEYRLQRNDGRYRWVLDQGVPRFLENGEFAGYVGCGIDITDQKTAETVQAEFGSRLIHAQEDERARIARELHDDINQRLALLANGIQELERAVTGSNRAKRREDLQALWRLTSEISADIQYLSHQLHPSKLHYLGLPAAMRGLCQEFATLQNIEVECVVRDTPSSLDENVSLSLYRTAQESLRNVAKHSHAQHVKVELVGMGTEIRLRISDDGIGFLYDESKNGQGLGLVSMQERVRLVGGQFSVWSRASLGTQVEAIVPIGAKLAQSA
jgi:PAS domain S-box-containing protein